MVQPSAARGPYAAIAEPRRRAILELVAEREHAVGELARALDLDQPTVSKHLRVLREARLVRVRRDGRHRLYSAHPEDLAPIRAWLERLERLWDHGLERVRERAEARARVETETESDHDNERGSSP